ncbi:hypothetical protein [Xylophilus sp. ASV27]|uniref:hypothetical protein n=1 Tax=Xylophilus sp. ASV27 TaxID=2795129 RepID=UPI0018EA6BD2|nr:hypothetical protein [Xylophilus sp. ASV27]
MFALQGQGQGQGQGTDGAAPGPPDRLTILTVDDDLQFQQALHRALKGFRYQDQPVRLQGAQSAVEAQRVLAEQPDVAVLVLDVVMETDDAGLRLVLPGLPVAGHRAGRTDAAAHGAAPE